MLIGSRYISGMARKRLAPVACKDNIHIVHMYPG